MKKLISNFLLVITLFIGTYNVHACSPCGPVNLVNMVYNAPTLTLNVTGQPNWPCQYIMMLEIRCIGVPFTGTFTHSTTSISANAGNQNTPIPFPTINVDLSAYCPGTYNIQGWMNTCGPSTAVSFGSFTIPGAVGLGLIVTPSAVDICPGESAQLTATANAGCGGGAVSYSWAPAAGLNNPNIAAPTATPGATTVYTVTATAACYVETASATVTVLTPSPVTASAIDDICSSSIGEVTATPDPGGVPNFSYYWLPPLGAATQTVSGVPTGNYTVEMTDGNGCVSTANVFVDDTPAAFQGSTTLVSCPGGADGTAFAEMVPELGTVSYLWNDPLAQTTQTATGLTAGNYTCTVTSTVGCVGIVNVVVTEIPGMIGNVVNITDVTCNSGSDGIMGINVVQGTPPYSYSWDNSSSNLQGANDLPAGPNTCTVTDDKGCVITVTGVVNEPPPLDITFLTPDTQICPEHEIELTVTGTGGSSPYTFTWFEGATELGTGTSITVDPDVTNTQYCVVMSEECGSPTDTECTLIYFPTPITPSAIPDESEKCVPGTFLFTHTSGNASEIATTYWEFDDNETHFHIEMGDDPTSWTYPYVGTYDVAMTVTSIYGCVYTDTMYSLVSVIDNPTANFGFSQNPTTIFETLGIQLQDKSSFDVIEWQYYSPGSVPMSSTDPNPIFDFPDGIEGQYPITLIVTTELGCTDTITLFLNVIADVNLFAPNAFTPDGDEFNQAWNVHVTGVDIFDFDLFVFNRWGEIVWESHDPNVGWDGTYRGEIVETGLYTWKAVVKKPYVDERINFTGFVNVLK